MSAPTYGERLVMALSEAGYPPDETITHVDGVRCARWLRPPPLNIFLKARTLAQPRWEFCPSSEWDQRPMQVALVELDDDQHAAHCAKVGKISLRVPS